MNTYIIKSKVEKIKEAKKDFFNLYGINVTPFTRKQFFYFFIYDNKKFVHKNSLNFVYTNADTFTYDKDPYFCDTTFQKNSIKLYDFLRTCDSELLPKLIEENDKFLVYEYMDGNPVTRINKEQYYFLKSCHDKMSLTPFYNSMAYNIIDTKYGLKLIDFKHFEEKDNKPFFVYFFNEEFNINELHFSERLQEIKNHLQKDYPVQDSLKIKY